MRSPIRSRRRCTDVTIGNLISYGGGTPVRMVAKIASIASYDVKPKRTGVIANIRTVKTKGIMSVPVGQCGIYAAQFLASECNGDIV